jgi:hypothetical protein
VAAVPGARTAGIILTPQLILVIIAAIYIIATIRLTITFNRSAFIIAVAGIIIKRTTVEITYHPGSIIPVPA